MRTKIVTNILMIIALFITSSCSKSNTKEFFFGSSDGPDPFVIGATLEPLKMYDIHQKNAELPKPKPTLSFEQMPSHAKKATEILGITTASIDTEQQPMINADSSDTAIITGSITESTEQVIDFQKFDAEMQKNYALQEKGTYLLPKLLGKQETIDPTVRGKLKQE